MEKEQKQKALFETAKTRLKELEPEDLVTSAIEIKKIVSMTGRKDKIQEYKVYHNGQQGLYVFKPVSKSIKVIVGNETMNGIIFKHEEDLLNKLERLEDYLDVLNEGR